MTTSDVHTTPSASKNHNRRVAIVSAALVAGLLGSGALVLRGTEAVFSANTDNPANSWKAGSVDLTDNRAGVAMFQAPVMAPGQTVTKCITVDYNGDVAAAVKLYVSASAGNLLPDLDVTIDELAGEVQTDCSDWDAVNDTTLFTNTLTNLGTTKATYGTGLSSWTPSGADTMSYRFAVTLGTDTLDAQQGETASATFKWEAKAGS